MANLYYNLNVTVHESTARETKDCIVNTRITPTLYDEMENIRKEIGFEKMPDLARHIFSVFCRDYRIREKEM